MNLYMYWAYNLAKTVSCLLYTNRFFRTENRALVSAYIITCIIIVRLNNQVIRAQVYGQFLQHMYYFHCR